MVFLVVLGVWWYSGFSLEFMKFFAAEPTTIPTTTPVSMVACSPATQTVKIGTQASLLATGGTGTYVWIAPEGSPATQTTGLEGFKVSYTTVGIKQVLVESAGDVITCAIVVTK